MVTTVSAPICPMTISLYSNITAIAGKLKLLPKKDKYRLSLLERASTDADGIARCLGLKAEANVELEVILKMLESKISEKTLLKL